MKTQLLKKQIAFITVIIVIFSSYATHAQIVYTDVNPDNTNSCSSQCLQIGGFCNETFDIDLNQDGQTDFTITTWSAPSAYLPCGAGVMVTSFNGNEVSGNNTWPLQINANSEIFSGVWTTSVGYLRRVYAGNSFSGLWTYSGDKYLGVSLMIDTNSYYGWIRLSVAVTGGFDVHASCTVRDFAYNSIPDS